MKDKTTNEPKKKELPEVAISEFMEEYRPWWEQWKNWPGWQQPGGVTTTDEGSNPTLPPPPPGPH